MSADHPSRMTSWVTVVLIVLASCLLGLALPMESALLGVVGGITLVAGLVTGVVFRIMDDAY